MRIEKIGEKNYPMKNEKEELTVTVIAIFFSFFFSPRRENESIVQQSKVKNSKLYRMLAQNKLNQKENHKNVDCHDD